MVASLRHLIAIGCVGVVAIEPAAGWAQTDTELDRAKTSVVMIQSKLPDGIAFGAGIVVAASAQDIYIVTADHLVRRNGTSSGVTVQFSQRPGDWVAARILDLRNGDLDLAAVAVSRPSWMTTAMLTGPGAVASSLARGTDVYALGYPQQRPWDMPVTADKVARTDTLKLTFQSQYVREGNSGGALLDSCGRIVGMVIISEPPNAEAVRIEPVLDTVARWGLQSRLLSVQPASPCGGLSIAAAPAATTPVAGRSSSNEIRQMHEREQWSESLPLLDRLIAEQPSLAEAYALRAHAYAHLERGTEATADGERAVKLGPRLAEAYLRRGEAKAVSGKRADALADYARAIQLDPKEFEAWVNQAWAFSEDGQFQKAVDSATQAIRLRTDRYDPWAVRGAAYLGLDNSQAAVADLTQAINRRNADPDLYRARAAAYFRLRQFDLALSDANQALRLKADYPDALVTRAAVYMAVNRNDDARKDLTYALQLRSGLKDATEILDDLNKRTGTTPPSATAAAPAVAAPPAAGGTAVAYARLLDQTSAALVGSRMAEAGALVDQMINLDGSRPEGWALRGALLVGADNLMGARAAYQNSLQRGGTAFFRLVHDHAGQPGCVGPVAVSQAGVTFAGENGGHQFYWPANAINEVALNPFYGVAVGMFHLRVRTGAANETFNFSVVRLNDVQILNRRPEAELIMELINRIRTDQPGR